MTFKVASVLFAVAVFTFTASSVDGSVRCYKCMGPNTCGDADSDTCTGDYCFSTRFAHPTLGGQQMLTAKGCVTTNLQPAFQPNTCMSYTVPRTSDGSDEGTERQVCFCDGTALCNSGDRTQTLVKTPGRYQTCSCSGYPYCSTANNQCTGQMCTYTTTTGQSAKQGCFNSTGPSIENALNSGCITPGLVDASAQAGGGQVDFNAFLDTETCMCDKGFCNRVNPQRRPQSGDAPKSRCTMKISMDILGVTSRDSNERSCEGDFCFEMTMDVNQMLKFRYRGCFSYPSSELENKVTKVKPGCTKVEIPMTIANVCFSKKCLSSGNLGCKCSA